MSRSVRIFERGSFADVKRCRAIWMVCMMFLRLMLLSKVRMSFRESVSESVCGGDWGSVCPWKSDWNVCKSGCRGCRRVGNAES